MVSVIVPVYNVAPYLREALDSVVGQTCRELEIIVVDDGSTDGSGAICDEYLRDPRVHVIHQENRGLSGARNAGLDRMTGEYVAFLDSDDAYKPDMIEKMLDALEKSGAEIAICGFESHRTDERLDRAGGWREYSPRHEREEIITGLEAQRRLLNDGIFVTAWSKLYRREIWNGLRFPEGHVYEDLWVIYQVLERCERVIMVPGAHILHRIWYGSITNTRSLKNTRDYLLALSVMESYVEAHVPKVFSEGELAALRERNTRRMSIVYAELARKGASDEAAVLLKDEALSRWRALEGRRVLLRTRAVRLLFLHAPGLIGAVRMVWIMVKKLLGRYDR